MARKLKLVHPGEVLREEFMLPRGLSMNKMAIDLRVPVTQIADIYHECHGITTDNGLRLARYFNTWAVFWVNLQWRHELQFAEDREAAKIARDVRSLERVSAK